MAGWAHAQRGAFANPEPLPTGTARIGCERCGWTRLHDWRNDSNKANALWEEHSRGCKAAALLYDVAELTVQLEDVQARIADFLKGGRS